uniref:GST C-terminal domain-containing protein n=2 Tax=Cacopsylla melanoneura TaxID=428564 RepID=A0A8D8Y3V5_9HEMI
MLRLFHRLLSTNNNNSSLTVEDQIVLDSALDTCHQLLYATQKNTAFALVKKLAEYLGSNEWMLGSSSLSIVDAAAWSAILNNKTISPNQLGPNVAKWSQKISALAGISQ